MPDPRLARMRVLPSPGRHAANAKPHRVARRAAGLARALAAEDRSDRCLCGCLPGQHYRSSGTGKLTRCRCGYCSGYHTSAEVDGAVAAVRAELEEDGHAA